MMKYQRNEQWWLVEATEICPTCGQAYAYHTEVRCFECDAPVCPICVQTTVSLDFSCPECFEPTPAEMGVGK